MKKARLFLKLIMMLLFITVSFFYAITFNNDIGWVIFFSIILFSLIICLSLLVPLKQITFKNIEPMWVQIDEKKLLELDIKNKAFFVPIAIITIDDLQIKKILPLFFQRNKSIQIDWVPKTRGYKDSLIIELQSSDFFSILKKSVNTKVSTKLYVFPKENTHVKQIIDLFEPTIRRNIIGESSFDLEKIRSYQPGDAVKGIDWKLSSKKQQLIYREYEQHEEGEILFLFYGTKSDHFEWMLSFYYTFYNKYAESRHRFILVGAGIKQSEQLEITDFCLIQNGESCRELQSFKEKNLVVFAPETSENLENILNNMSSGIFIQLIDYQLIKGRGMV